jgi:hypothetical protein
VDIFYARLHIEAVRELSLDRLRRELERPGREPRGRQRSAQVVEADAHLGDAGDAVCRSRGTNICPRCRQLIR